MNPSLRQSARVGPGPLALLLPDLSGGGGERVTLTLGGALAQRGVDVDLVVGNAAGPLLAEIPPRVDLVDLEQARLRSALPALTSYLRLRRPAWIMPTVDHANVLGSLAVRRLGHRTRTVLRPSTTLSVAWARATGSSARFHAALSRSCYRNADAVVACSVGMADDLARFCGRPRDTIDVIPNATLGPDLPTRAAETLDDPWFDAGAPPVLLTVGRLAPPKDAPTVLEAFAQLRRVRPVRLVMLGEGPQRPELERRARELGVEDDVRLPGFDVNPYRYMARAAVFVLSSTREGLPGVLIEALACGARVVATDCPSGPSEILEAGRWGRLVPPGDARAMALALAATLDEPPLASADAVARYRAEAVAEAYVQVLERVCDDVPVA